MRNHIFSSVTRLSRPSIPSLTDPLLSFTYRNQRRQLRGGYESAESYQERPSFRTLMALDYYTFGPHKICSKEVFYTTHLSFVMVNLRPVLPDVLVCPKREVKRVADLTADEISDLWLTAQKVGRRLERHHKASSLTFTIQDGPQAGQTVPHVHIHILPRKVGDFEKNDEIYDAIDENEKEFQKKLDLDEERKDRSPEERAQEADEYRMLFS